MGSDAFKKISNYAIPVAGAVAGGFGNSTGARTGTYSNQNQYTNGYTSTSGSSGTSTTTKNLSDFQKAIEPDLYGYGLGLIKNPSQYIDPIRKAATAQINQNYSSAPSGIAQKMLAYGGSKSGKFGKAMVQSELARYSDINNLNGQLAPLTMQQQNFGANLLQQMLGLNYGSTTTNNNTATNSGVNSGTSSGSGINIAPGSTIAGALQGGLNGLGILAIINQMLKAQGSSPSGGDPNASGGGDPTSTSGGSAGSGSGGSSGGTTNPPLTGDYQIPGTGPYGSSGVPDIGALYDVWRRMTGRPYDPTINLTNWFQAQNGSPDLYDILMNNVGGQWGYMDPGYGANFAYVDPGTLGAFENGTLP